MNEVRFCSQVQDRSRSWGGLWQRNYSTPSLVPKEVAKSPNSVKACLGYCIMKTLAWFRKVARNASLFIWGCGVEGRGGGIQHGFLNEKIK